MKLTLILLFLFTTSMFASVHSQNMRVNINVKNVRTQEVLSEIERQTDYLFIYDADEINLDRKVSVKAEGQTVANVLSSVFGGTDVSYAMEGSNIMLMKKESQTDSTQQDKRQITGTVVDATGIPVIGANVMVKGTTNGTITDMDGKFVLEVSEDALLEISYIGYLSQSVKVTGNKVSVTLKEDTQKLDEVVVVGYGTMKKGEIASSISSIKSEKFIKTPTTDAAQLIKGQVPGLSIITPDANPTSTSEISLRGISTLKSSSSPLVLIDGIPGDLNSVSPDDIEQIDVLKDGSAAAIYGTRGTNGVILITTKNARGEMPTEVDVNAYVSTQQIVKKLPFMNADEYRLRVKEGVPGAQDDGATTNWLDEVTRTPLTQIYNISLRGGSKTTNYVASFEYRGLNGLMKRTNNQMYYPRVEITHRMFNNKLKLNASLSGYKQTYFSGSDGGSYNSNIYRNALIYNPTTPIYTDDGEYSESTKNEYFNPVALQNEVEGKNEASNLRMFANVTFTPFEGLDIKYLISSNTYNQIRGYYETQKHMSTWRDDRYGFASRGSTRTTQDLSELTIQWRKTFKKEHSITLLGGYSWQKDHYQNFYMQNFDFPSDDYTYNNIGAGQAIKDGRATEFSTANESRLIGYFTRFNYSYKGKYMFAASIRHEGSTKFGADHKWGNFPSVSAAWNIKGEDFLSNVNLISNLKIRAGYGVTGTVPTDPYMSLNTLNWGTYVFYNNAWIKTIRPDSNANPDLRWERKKELNIGLDFGFFNDRIFGNIDFYNRKTEDLLWNYDVPSPPYLFSNMVANAGSMKNTGIEVGISIIPIQTDNIQWLTSFNYSTNKNELLSLSNDKFVSSGYSDQGHTGEPIQTTTHRIQEGEPIGNFWGYKSVGIDDNGHWLIEGSNGEIKPISEQQPTDKQVIGNGLPKHFLNWNNTFSWKGFDLSVTMRGAFGFDILNMPRLQYGAPVMLARGNVLNEAFDLKYGKVPLALDQELQYVSYYIENGDYWKIDNLTLGYTFNFDTWVKKLRIYGTISNLATITGYSGIDPEVSMGGLAPGIDNKNRYPSARSYTLGISINF
ncbi:MAG: TonB-dependent receptor [Parabacteroides sp.]|nr:TonB-dependent receptor [Parabacteroides sp.]